MKTLLNKAVFFLSIVLAFTACDDREYTMINPNANTTVSLSTNSVVLTEETAADEAVTVSWTEPDFGFSDAPTYRILLNTSGGDIANAQAIPAGSDLSMAFTVEELNSKLLAMELEPEVETTIDIVVETKLSNSSIINSAPVNLSVTPYSTVLDLSTTWGIVGDATPNGWDGPDVPFYQTGTDGVLVAYTTLIDGEIKFRENNDWTLNYGDDGADGTLEEGSANIVVAAGSYKIEMNLNDLTYTIEPYSWGLVGDATANGWDGPDVPLEYDPSTDTWKAIATLTDGEMKIRQNNDWAVNYGDDGADGTLEEGAANIVVSAGNYLVTVDFNSLEYSIEPVDIWGVIGDATPGGWDADTDMEYDFANDVWTLTIDLIAGEMKFRANDDWSLNYGDDGADGSLDQDGANIAITTAGNYSIVLDITNLNYSLTQN